MSNQDDAKALHATLLEQERDVQFDSFGHDDSWAVGSTLRELSAARKHPVAIAIMLGEQRVFHVGLPGSTADNDDWLARKFRVVGEFGHSSLAVGTDFKARGLSFEADSGLDVRLFAAHGGAFPLIVRDSIVGVVGVSGLAQRDDHDLVIEVLTAYRDGAAARS